jgi:tRNA-dihydrouridine synthase 1
VPVFAKVRVFPDLERTLKFVRMLEDAGCSLITVHGRTRDNTSHDGPCDWGAIRACVEAVQIPV